MTRQHDIAGDAARPETARSLCLRDRAQIEAAENEGMAAPASDAPSMAPADPAACAAGSREFDRPGFALKPAPRSPDTGSPEQGPRPTERLIALFARRMRTSIVGSGRRIASDLRQRFMRAPNPPRGPLAQREPARLDPATPNATKDEARPPSASQAKPSRITPRFRVRECNGIWRVSLDGAFYGDYRLEADARRASASAFRRMIGIRPNDR